MNLVFIYAQTHKHPNKTITQADKYAICQIRVIFVYLQMINFTTSKEFTSNWLISYNSKDPYQQQWYIYTHKLKWTYKTHVDTKTNAQDDKTLIFVKYLLWV